MTSRGAMMEPFTRLQDYFRASAAQRYEMVSVPPFTLFFHPTDDFPDFNYAIPDQRDVNDAREVLVEVEREYHAARPAAADRVCRGVCAEIINFPWGCRMERGRTPYFDDMYS